MPGADEPGVVTGLPATVLQVFARAPTPGACKRRLIPALGEHRSARLQELMMQMVLDAASVSSAGSVELWCEPDAEHHAFAQAARTYGIKLKIQTGGGLGERMYYALHSAADAGRAPVLVGTDCPAHSTKRLNEALAAVTSGAGAVLRPARDGGYVCIGAADPKRAWFDGVPWGSDKVMQATRARLSATVADWVELPALADVDVPGDLAVLPASLLARLDHR